MPSKTRNFFLNALSLTLTALIMRGVSVIFNVYISNRAGSETMGLYSLLGSVYGFAITLGAAGINLGTTRLISEALGKGDGNLAKKYARSALVYCSCTGSLASLLLFVLAPAIGSFLLGDPRAITPLRILALTLPFVAICSCLSGYFTGVRRVKINAAFQIVAQIFKFSVTIALLTLFVGDDTEQACIALVLGGAISELITLFFSYFLYLRDIKKLPQGSCNANPTARNITKLLLGITLPLTFSACIRSLLTMLQHVLVPRGLQIGGASLEEALSAYGLLHGMALPIVLFPSAFISAFAGLLIPEVSEFCVQQNDVRLQRVSYRALSLSLIFSIGVSGIMVFFSDPLGKLIYADAEVGRYIRILAPLIPVMYIDSAVDAVLKGSGHQVYSMNVNIADALIACIFALTLIPSMGIWGYVISIYATEILNTTLSLCKMTDISRIRIGAVHQVIMPLLCIIGATNFANLILRAFKFHSFTSLDLILQILLTVLLYMLFLFMTKTIGNDEREVIRASLQGGHLRRRIKVRHIEKT